MRADDVVDVGMHRDRGVRDQRPRGGGPHQQVGLAGERPGCDGETHVDRRVGDVLVALREFVIGQGGAAARAVRGHPVVLLKEALVEDLLERPPARLHVLGGHRDVGLVEVHPVPHAAGQLGEGVDVPQHRFAALRVERLHPVGLDVGFAGETEFLLDGEFDGQAVAVPAGLAVDAVALHRLETRKQVLEDAGLDVVRPGHAVGGRRALVEGPRFAVAGALEGLREGVAFSPQGDDLALQGGEINGCGDCVVGTHRYLGCWLDEPEGRAGTRGTTLLGRAGRPTRLSIAAGSSELAPFFRQLRGDGPINALRCGIKYARDIRIGQFEGLLLL